MPTRSLVADKIVGGLALDTDQKTIGSDTQIDCGCVLFERTSKKCQGTQFMSRCMLKNISGHSKRTRGRLEYALRIWSAFHGFPILINCHTDIFSN